MELSVSQLLIKNVQVLQVLKAYRSNCGGTVSGGGQEQIKAACERLRENLAVQCCPLAVGMV